MEISLTHPLVYLVPLASFILGYGIARNTREQRHDDEIRSAVADEQEKFLKEQGELSEELGEKLGQMREGLISTIQAYQSAVQTCSERLPISAEVREQLDSGELVASASSADSEEEEAENEQSPEQIASNAAAN